MTDPFTPLTPLRGASVRLGSMEMPLTRALGGVLFIAVGVVWVCYK